MSGGKDGGRGFACSVVCRGGVENKSLQVQMGRKNVDQVPRRALPVPWGPPYPSISD